MLGSLGWEAGQFSMCVYSAIAIIEHLYEKNQRYYFPLPLLAVP